MQPQQQQVRVPEFICELSQPQILSQACSTPFWSLGGTPPHTASAFFLRHHELFRLHGANVNSPEGGGGRFPT